MLGCLEGRSRVVIGGRVGRYLRVGVYTTFGLFFHLIHSYKICLHISTCRTRGVRRASSVVFQRLRLDVVSHAAPGSVHLAGEGRCAMVAGRLLQDNGLLRLCQGTVEAGLILEGRGGGRPGHTGQPGTF